MTDTMGALRIDRMDQNPYEGPRSRSACQLAMTVQVNANRLPAHTAPTLCYAAAGTGTPSICRRVIADLQTAFQVVFASQQPRSFAVRVRTRTSTRTASNIRCQLLLSLSSRTMFAATARRFTRSIQANYFLPFASCCLRVVRVSST